MSNATARTLLRSGLARPQTARISHDVARATTVGATVSYSSRAICHRCERRPLLACASPRSSPYILNGVRNLHASPALSKSKKKEEPQKRAGGRGKGAEKPTASNAADDGPKHPQPSPEDILNFADVESRLSKQAEHFRATLKQMQTGARFDPDVLGGLRVTVDKKTGETYPLHELAEVVWRGGRVVSLLVHEDEWVKPIMSAVQGSPQFNQQPQRDPDNALELILKIEPEKREDLVKRAKTVTHEWRERIRAIRQKRDKLHATWKKDGTIVPDVKTTADKELDKIIKVAVAEVDAAEKSTIKAAESK